MSFKSSPKVDATLIGPHFESDMGSDVEEPALVQEPIGGSGSFCRSLVKARLLRWISWSFALHDKKAFFRRWGSDGIRGPPASRVTGGDVATRSCLVGCVRNVLECLRVCSTTLISQRRVRPPPDGSWWESFFFSPQGYTTVRWCGNMFFSREATGVVVRGQPRDPLPQDTNGRVVQACVGQLAAVTTLGVEMCVAAPNGPLTVTDTCNVPDSSEKSHHC